MDTTARIPPDFSRQVHEALAHLHSRTYLASLPLATLLGSPNLPLSGEALRSRLLEAIEQLKPVRSSPVAEGDWRRYHHLVLRYIEGQNRDQVAQALQVSLRQASRDHEQAIDTLARVLWVQSSARLSVKAASRDGESTVAAVPVADAVIGSENENVGIAPTTEIDLAEVLQGALVTLRALLADRLVRVDLSLPSILPLVAADRDLLRQAFLNLLGYASKLVSEGQLRITAADLIEGIVVRISIEWDAANDIDKRLSIEENDAVDGLFSLGRKLLQAQGG